VTKFSQKYIGCENIGKMQKNVHEIYIITSGENYSSIKTL